MDEAGSKIGATDPARRMAGRTSDFDLFTRTVHGKRFETIQRARGERFMTLEGSSLRGILSRSGYHWHIHSERLSFEP
jgi:hypothetical protein